MIAPSKISEESWQNFSVNQKDIESIYNLLLEKAVPLSAAEILDYVISFRINQEMASLKKQKSEQGNIYLPKNNYNIGDNLVFPYFNMENGRVIAVHDGFNPDIQNLKIIEIEFETGKTKDFASNYQTHSLNRILEIPENDPNLDSEMVKENFGKDLIIKLNEELNKNDDLVKIAGNWFPRSLLVDVHIGHLNLAEAILEEADGGPMNTFNLMQQVELTANVDQKLLEFSFDLALQEDKRFDEVGPTGLTQWFLKDAEPIDVKEIPLYLKYTPRDYSFDGLDQYMTLFESNLLDEHEPMEGQGRFSDKAIISLPFPHWRAGTLPLSSSLKQLFPSAYEAPRIMFTFHDLTADERFPGWVVRESRYISGLEKWYKKNNLLPGSLVSLEKSDIPGEIKINYEKSRQNKEWLKTVLVGSDHGIVFAMLKHPITANFNERMAVAIPDIDAVDEIWRNRIYEKESIDKTIIRIMRELAKLNPQRQVHAQELYAAVNVVRRCPPSLVLFHLLKSNQVERLGDLYFRIFDKE